MQNSQQIEEPICKVNGERVVKRYKKIKIVGEGSYSKCWLVRTVNSDSEYVAKIIPKSKLELLVKEKLVYEIRIHQQLSHPNVVHLDHWFEDQNYQYIFMEYCSEGNLERRMQTSHKMGEKEIAFYVRQVVNAIMYIHSKGILHRDLKLCNFYIDSNDQLKLGDFGFACQLSHEGELKRETCGTPNYIAPQAVSGFGYSLTSDVWAVGVILYRLKNVKQTLQKVKTCQYSFPTDKKISVELKDLIEKILVINYDQRLTLEQILGHPFFEVKHPRCLSAMPVKQEEKGFSLFRLFSRDKTEKVKQSKEESENKEGRESRIREQQRRGRKSEISNKRSNSCETFKQIKEILKNKSKGSLLTNMGTDLKTEENMNMSLNTQTNRNIHMGNGTMRSIAETSISMNLINRRLQQNSRVNHFMGSVKEQLKLTNKPMPSSQIKTGISNVQQLNGIAKKYYLPYEVQLQRDVVVVHYKDSIKQIIYHGSSFILHRSRNNLYQMNGQLYLNPPKLLRYLIDNKIEIAEAEPQEAQYGENSIEKILLFVSHRFVVGRDGIILRFGSAGLFVAKMASQQLFYLGSASKQGERLKEDGKLSLMYTRENRTYKYAEGVVLSRIYQGWIYNCFKSNPSKQ